MGSLWNGTESVQCLNHLCLLKYSLYRDLSAAGFTMSAKSQTTARYKKCLFRFFDFNATCFIAASI